MSDDLFDEWIATDTTMTLDEWVAAGCPKAIRNQTYIGAWLELPHDANCIVEGNTFYGIQIR